MAEETVGETVTNEVQEAKTAEDAAETQPSPRPSSFKFAGSLLGGWLALMIVFVLFATVAMNIVGSLGG